MDGMGGGDAESGEGSGDGRQRSRSRRGVRQVAHPCALGPARELGSSPTL
jgi:hypothetical protein